MLLSSRNPFPTIREDTFFPVHSSCEELLDDCTHFFLSITADVLHSSPRARFGMAN